MNTANPECQTCGGYGTGGDGTGPCKDCGGPNVPRLRVHVGPTSREALEVELAACKAERAALAQLLLEARNAVEGLVSALEKRPTR